MSTEYFRYLPISKHDSRWGLCVKGAGYAQMSPGGRYPQKTHPAPYQFMWPQRHVVSEYQALYIFNGAGEFESQSGGFLKVSSGSLILIFPNNWHSYRPAPEVGWDEYWVSFSGEIIDRLVEQDIISPKNPIIPVGLNETILHYYLAILDRVKTEPPGYQQLIAADVFAILGAAISSGQDRPHWNENAKLVRKAKFSMEQTTNELVNIEELAATCHLSVAQFRRIFKQQVGMPPYQYYLQVRINRAKELLRDSSLPIQRISHMLHFENPFQFSRTFKEKTGLAPSQWRKRMSFRPE